MGSRLQEVRHHKAHRKEILQLVEAILKNKTRETCKEKQKLHHLQRDTLPCKKKKKVIKAK